LTESPHETPADERISWPQLIAYGAGGIIPIALFNIAGQLMGLLGNISLGLSAVWLGAIMMVPRLWDAVSDPVMGHITDNTRSRWGRRRPYLLFGGVAVAVTFVAIWWVPRGPNVEAWFGSAAAYNWFQLAFILGGMLTFYTACTVFEIPHGALGMEMSDDYHERTRLFSAKSFLGNLFAMGTPWLIAVASWEFFRGPGGDLVDGMRYVSIAIAAVLIPLSVWWFWMVKEPAFSVARPQRKSAFWEDMRTTAGNKVFLRLVLIVFTLAVGFNFVNNFGNYIKIFYLYGGDVSSAGILLGIDGTVWAVTGLLAVFPLNWISKRIGKNATLRIAVLLMCVAQLSKVVCYDPNYPYLVLVPTVLLSAGMLMFFTLGSSMVGDICDYDELQTGTRSEGSYYSVFWWFVKLGTAMASLGMGLLLHYTDFDETQNVTVSSLRGSIEVVKSDAVTWQEDNVPDTNTRRAKLDNQLAQARSALEKVQQYFDKRVVRKIDDHDHTQTLISSLPKVKQSLAALEENQAEFLNDPKALEETANSILRDIALVNRQSPTTLFRLRAVEIGLPLVLCGVSLWLTLGYPLTEDRCYEITAELKARRAARGQEEANE